MSILNLIVANLAINGTAPITKNTTVVQQSQCPSKPIATSATTEPSRDSSRLMDNKFDCACERIALMEAWVSVKSLSRLVPELVVHLAQFPGDDMK